MCEKVFVNETATTEIYTISLRDALAIKNMKYSASKVDGFMRSHDPDIRAILIYGPDGGLVRERADTLARQVVDDLDDPFRVSELSLATLREDPSRFADEAAALALTGGRRVVRLRAAGDKQADVIAAYLADPIGDSLILIESGELPPRSKLRKAFESSRIAAALPCFPDEGNALERVIEQTAKIGRASCRERV